jgi:sec-independent protein translocase protein TatA
MVGGALCAAAPKEYARTMLANVFGPDLGIFVVIAVVVIFGGSQLPKIARNVGSAGKEFRKAQREAEEEEAAKAAATPTPVPPAVTAGPAVTTTPAPTPTPVVADDDKVVISKTELAALLDERLGKDQTSTKN